MKVLVLSHMYPNPVNPHAGIFVHNQCKALVQAGVQVQVICPTPSFPFYPKWNGYRKLPRETTYEGIPVRYIPTQMFPAGLFFSTYGYWYEKSCLPVLTELYQTFPFDVIHAHTIFPDGNAAIRMKEPFKVPVISTVHGSDIMLYPKRSKGVYQQTRYALEESNQVITVSNRLQTAAEAIYPEVKVQTIYNGFNPAIFAPGDTKKARERLGIPLDQKICLFIGNLYPVKGLTYLLQAFAKLVKTEAEIHLYIVGDGKLKSSLQAEAKSLGLAQSVSWMGRKPYEEIPSWIQSADLLVLSSLSEGLPSILLESMACGKPMIATDVGGIAEILQDGRTGRLVPAQDAQALSRALVDMLVDHPEQLQQMGHAAYQASQELTWEQNAHKMIACYESLVQNA